MQDQKIISGYYFYQNHTFIQQQINAEREAIQVLGKSLNEAINDEDVLNYTWSIDELAILLGTTVSQMIESKTIVLNVNLIGKETAAAVDFKNDYRKVNAKDLSEAIKEATLAQRERVKAKVYEMLKEPKKQRADAERRKINADSETSSRAILNEICSLDAEIVAYCKVIELLK